MVKSSSLGPVEACVANILVIGVSVYAWALFAADADLYYLSVQEDEYLEWGTFWAFILAVAVYGRRAFQPSFAWRDAWFLLGLALFCLVVALEEISWAQRIIGYRPPEYFLESNFQQELNFHNLLGTGVRKTGLFVVIFGYGVIARLLAMIPVVRRLLVRLGIVTPPSALIPAFALTGLAYIRYPLKFTGEWVEFMLGLCFAFSALAVSSGSAPASSLRRSGLVAAASVAVVVGGIATAQASRLQRSGDPGNVRAAQMELEALKRDFLSGKVNYRCGGHDRLHSFVERYDQTHLYEGEFAGLTSQGLPPERAEFMLDPWNYAYWLRDSCRSRRRGRTTYLYSFGPNRRRDSTRWEIGGDDIAVVVRGSL